jgi:hypothetical protein
MLTQVSRKDLPRAVGVPIYVLASVRAAIGKK